MDLQERLSRDIVRGVLDGSTDLGILAGPVSAEGLQVMRFSTDRLVLATPLNHPLALKGKVKLAETLTHPHIGLQEGTTLLRFLREQVEALGSTLVLRIQVYGFEAICRMVEAGVGIAVLPNPRPAATSAP